MKDEAQRPLEGLLKDIVGGLGSKGIFTQEDMAAAWELAVGKKAAKHSKVRSLKGSRLIVSVDDSSWLYELTVQKKDILKKLSSEVKGKQLKDITFRIGEVQ